MARRGFAPENKINSDCTKKTTLKFTNNIRLGDIWQTLPAPLLFKLISP